MGAFVIFYKFHNLLGWYLVNLYLGFDLNILENVFLKISYRKCPYKYLKLKKHLQLYLKSFE